MERKKYERSNRESEKKSIAQIEHVRVHEMLPSFCMFPFSLISTVQSQYNTVKTPGLPLGFPNCCSTCVQCAPCNLQAKQTKWIALIIPM